MSQNRSTVEAVVKSYFDGLYEGNADRDMNPAPQCGFAFGRLE